MSKGTKIILVLILILAIVCLIVFFNQKNSENKTANSDLNEVAKNVANEIMNKIENTNKIENISNENEIVNNVENNSTTNSNVETPKIDNSEKAIDMVKQEWGKDDSVTFKIDEQTEDGKYVISVVEKNTTKVIMWYNVDVVNNTIEEK